MTPNPHPNQNIRRVLVDAGHYPICLPADGVGETVGAIDQPIVARTTAASLRTFAAGAARVRALHDAGVPATLGVLVGDLAVPAAARPRGVDGLPPSYRAVANAHGLLPEAIALRSEASARNRGKKLVDRARHGYAGAEATYRHRGWAFCTDGNTLAVATDRTLEGNEGLVMCILVRGDRALCPAILLGHQQLIARDGFTEHEAIYSSVDDPHIARKLWASTHALGAIAPDLEQLVAHTHIIESDERGSMRTVHYTGARLHAPGELPYRTFAADLTSAAPGWSLPDTVRDLAVRSAGSGCGTGCGVG